MLLKETVTDSMKRLTIPLLLLVPPRFTTKPSRLVWTTVGPTEFRCAATGVPLPSLYWLKNGKELSSSGSAKITYHKGRADLTLSSVTPSDAAMYQCFAKNEAGSIQAGACLIVQRIGNKLQDITKHSDTEISRDFQFFSSRKYPYPPHPKKF